MSVSLVYLEVHVIINIIILDTVFQDPQHADMDDINGIKELNLTPPNNTFATFMQIYPHPHN
jgi:hypothetical protein